jgi:predicted secreted protein with PEFG-CTERM motif
LGFSLHMRYFLLVIVLSILSFIIPSFAQVAEPLITTSTDKSEYKIGDTIVISGSVKSVVEGTPLTIQILDPDRNIVKVDQIDVAQDGKYTTTAKAAGNLWKKDGTYTVKVQYGPQNVVVETNFQFTSSTVIPTQIFEVNAENEGTFDVEYSITGGTVKDMVIDFEGLSLIVSIDSTSDGTMTLKIPRELMDAKTTSGDDDMFIVLIDGAEVEAQQTSTSGSRTLTINFLKGDSDVEIIGTQIVPEFGAIAALVLAVAIISIIAVSAKTRLRLMPKY